MPASVTYSSNGAYIAWGARHQHSENVYFPRLLKVATREMDPEMFRNDHAATADRVFYTAYAPGGRQLIMLSYGQAVLYDIKTGSIIRKFPGTSATSVTAGALSPDGKIFAAASENNIRLWTME
jgi:WD40 repeat protein